MKNKITPAVSIIEDCDKTEIPLHDIKVLNGVNLDNAGVTVGSSGEKATVLHLDETDKILWIDKKINSFGKKKLIKGEILIIQPQH